MADVLLFHHAQGMTPGITAFADELRAAGHTVYVPDLFDGRTFSSIDEGMAFITAQGFDALRERGIRTADELPAELVYAGFSFGETIAQQLAQTRAGARGALLFYSCIPISGEWAFGPWPTMTRSSSTRATSTRPGRLSRPSTTQSCSYTRATSTTSPTAPSRLTTPRPRRCS